MNTVTSETKITLRNDTESWAYVAWDSECDEVDLPFKVSSEELSALIRDLTTLNNAVLDHKETHNG